MSRHVLIVSSVILAAVAGCGGHGKTAEPSAKSPVAAASRSACAPADDSCIPPDHPTSGPIAVPVAKIGQPIRYQAGGDQGAITQEVTVLKMKTAKLIADPAAGYTAEPDPGHIYLCVEVRIQNVGTTPGDAYLGSQWFGLDGKTEEPALVGGVGCDDLGMSDDLSGQPDPQPGKYVTGSTLYELPAAAGALEVTDRDGTPLFRIDYGPQSAQVRINAVGQ